LYLFEKQQHKTWNFLKISLQEHENTLKEPKIVPQDLKLVVKD